MQDGLTWFQPLIRLCQSAVAGVYAIIALSAQLIQYMAVVRSKGNSNLSWTTIVVIIMVVTVTVTVIVPGRRTAAKERQAHEPVRSSPKPGW
jgi:hypothetical protein